MDFVESAGDFIRSLNFKVITCLQIKGKSGTTHEVDIRFGDEEETFLAECKSGEVTIKDLFTVYGRFTDLNFDLGFFIAESLSKQEMNDLRKLGLVPLVLSNSEASRSNFKRELLKAVEDFRRRKVKLPRRVREINSFYIKVAGDVVDSAHLKQVLTELAARSEYGFEFKSSTDRNFYVTLHGLRGVEFAVNIVLRQFARWDTDKITTEKMTMIRNLISSSQSLEPLRPSRDSLLQFIDFVTNLKGCLRGFSAHSREPFLTNINVYSSYGEIPKSELLNALAFRKVELSKLSFKLHPRGSMKLYFDPTLRMKYHGIDSSIIENWRSRCEHAILEGFVDAES